MFNNEKLKECRKQAGYTQLDMARLIGVAMTTYAEYEQDVRQLITLMINTTPSTITIQS